MSDFFYFAVYHAINLIRKHQLGRKPTNPCENKHSASKKEITVLKPQASTIIYISINTTLTYHHNNGGSVFCITPSLLIFDVPLPSFLVDLEFSSQPTSICKAFSDKGLYV